MPERNELLRQTINKLLLLHSTLIKGDQRKKLKSKESAAAQSTQLLHTLYFGKAATKIIWKYEDEIFSGAKFAFKKKRRRR